MSPRLNIVFYIPQDIKEKAIALSREMGSNNKAFFVLDGIDFYPHITIYSPRFSESKIEEVVKAVREIADRTRKTEMVFKEITSHQGFVTLRFENSFSIKKLHEEIVFKLNPLRESKNVDESDYHAVFGSEQQKSIEKYGYPHALDQYSPHMTIIRLEDAFWAENVSKRIKWDIPKFTVDKIAIYRMGQHGTCRELIK
jgi:2'-5' RNA ligase